MIGNLRNMAIDMGSELENQNRQIDRINLKVIYGVVFALYCPVQLNVIFEKKNGIKNFC